MGKINVAYASFQLTQNPDSEFSVSGGGFSADFTVGGAAHPIFGPGPRAAQGQFGPCGASARGGVRIPSEVVAGAENVTQRDGESIDSHLVQVCGLS